MIHAGGESARRHNWILLRARAYRARYRGYFGYPAFRACLPYANCRDGRQKCGATRQASSRQRQFAAFIRREKSRRSFPLSFLGEKWPLATACRFCATLVLDAAPLTERLRFRIGPSTKTITFLCRLVGAEGAPPLFAGAVLDVSDLHERAHSIETHARLAGRARTDAAGQRDEQIELERRKDTLIQSRSNGASGSANLEMELRRQKNEFRELSAILDTATDGVAVLDRQGLILTLNRSGEALFGYDQNEVAGRLFINLMAPDSRALVADYFEGLKSDGGFSLLNQGREVVGLARQGGTIPVFMTLSRIGGAPSEGEQPEVRFCAILRDLTH